MVPTAGPTEFAAGIHRPKTVVEDILGILDRDTILRDARAEILAKLKA